MRLNHNAGMTQLQAFPRTVSFASRYYYLPELREEDELLGFRCYDVLCPTANDSTRRVEAVVYSIDASNRIVRIYDPQYGRPGYLHQCFGIGESIGAPSWHPVQVVFPSARMALWSWRTGRDNLKSPDATLPYIQPMRPSGREF